MNFLAHRDFLPPEEVYARGGGLASLAPGEGAGVPGAAPWAGRGHAIVDRLHEELTLQGTKMFEDTYVNLVPRSWQQTIRDEEPGRLLAAMCVVDSQSELIR